LKIIVSGGSKAIGKSLNTRQLLSRRFYAFHPVKALMPVLLIGAGLFAVVITGVNRVRITGQSVSSAGGTGGYQIWAETSVPVKENINNKTGRKAFGLDDSLFRGVTFVQAKRGAGDDASCLNLNMVASPPLLGINTADFIRNRSFSFSSTIKPDQKSDPWKIIDSGPSGNTIFGFADQTVLEWGLKKKTGDTLKLRTESGDQLNIVIAGGLKSSIFQGYLLISEDNFNRYFPSVAGYSVFLIRNDTRLTDSISAILKDRLGNYGIAIQKATGKLASFFSVTNTYLSVFTMLGGFGMMLGVLGLGLVLHRNYTSRRKEFALLITSGFTNGRIKGIILREQIFILLAGIITGVASGLISASASVGSFNEIPWISILSIVAAIAITGVVSVVVSVNGIKPHSLISILRKE
jgi:ABC-type antimicrobial peptide transport system permease subunit